MNDSRLIVDSIHRSVSVYDAVRRYLPDTNMIRNRIPCPIHSGKGYNMGISDELFHCFVCGARGDVITFVQRIMNLNFKDALAKINDDFFLGLPIKSEITKEKKAELERKRIEYLAKKEAERLAEEEAKQRYWKLMDKWIEYDKAIRELKPKRGDFIIDERYIRAVKNIKYIEYLIDERR